MFLFYTSFNYHLIVIIKLLNSCTNKTVIINQNNKLTHYRFQIELRVFQASIYHIVISFTNLLEPQSYIRQHETQVCKHTILQSYKYTYYIMIHTVKRHYREKSCDSCHTALSWLNWRRFCSPKIKFSGPTCLNPNPNTYTIPTPTLPLTYPGSNPNPQLWNFRLANPKFARQTKEPLDYRVLPIEFWGKNIANRFVIKRQADQIKATDHHDHRPLAIHYIEYYQMWFEQVIQQQLHLMHL